MKRKLLFIAVLTACASMVSAQQTISKQNFRETSRAIKEEVPTVDKVYKAKEAECNTHIAAPATKDFPITSIAKAAADEELKAYYLRPTGTYVGGIKADGSGYVPVVIGHSQADWKFLNQSTGYSGISWTINNDPDLMDTDGDGNGIFSPGLVGNFYIPTVDVTNGATTSSYYYGKESVDAGQASYALAVASDNIVMSYADFENSPMYTGVGGGAYGYGTGVTNNLTNTGVMQHFEKPQAPLYVEAIGAFIHSANNVPLPRDGKLTCTVWTLSDDNKLKDVIVSADIYSDELIHSFSFSSGRMVFYARFTFVEYDPETGLETEIDLVLDEAYGVTIEGFNDEGVDAGVVFADNRDYYGNAYVLLEGGYQTSYGKEINGEWRNGSDLAIMIEGSYTALILDERTAEVTAPVEGGLAYFTIEGAEYNNIIINSTYDLEGLAIEYVPSWIEISGDNSDYAKYSDLYVYANTAPLPAGLEGRAEYIVLSSYGASCSILVKQGDVSNIDGANVEWTKAVRNGNNFDLTYPTNVNSVSVLNAAGQTVANYELNESGKFTMPASNLTNGLYILKFNGEKNTTVKIIK